MKTYGRIQMRVRKCVALLSIFTVLGFHPVDGWAASKQAPDFREVDLSGQTHTLQQYAGKTLVLYFWASWCPYCRKDVSSMIQVYKKYQPRGIQFLSVSMDENESKIRSFVEKHQIPYPVAFRGQGWGHPLAKLYELDGIPTYVIIDGEGKIVDMNVGAEALSASLSQYV